MSQPFSFTISVPFTFTSVTFLVRCIICYILYHFCYVTLFCYISHIPLRFCCGLILLAYRLKFFPACSGSGFYPLKVFYVPSAGHGALLQRISHKVFWQAFFFTEWNAMKDSQKISKNILFLGGTPEIPMRQSFYKMKCNERIPKNLKKDFILTRYTRSPYETVKKRELLVFAKALTW